MTWEGKETFINTALSIAGVAWGPILFHPQSSRISTLDYAANELDCVRPDDGLMAEDVRRGL